MNILLVHNRYQIPGGEDTVFESEKELLESHGHRVFCYERSNAELKDMNLFQKICVPFSMIYSFRSAKEIREIIKCNNIDIVHVHNTLLRISPSVNYIAVKEQVPVVQTIHNFRMICPNGICYRDGTICEDCAKQGLKCAIKHSCYRNSKLQTIALVLSMKIHRLTGIYKKLHYICLTEFNKQQLLKQGQITPDQITVRPNSIKSEDHIVPYDKRKNQMIFAGRLDETKGIRFLLDVWKQMTEHPYELVIYGSGPLEECKQIIENNHLSDISLMGRIDHDALMEILSDSKALILPTQWYEGFPMSMLEAMSKGTPVIVPDMGNAGSITVNGVNGYTYQPNDIDDCIRAINENMDINDSVFHYFNQYYSQEVNYQVLMELYGKVAGKNE